MKIISRAYTHAEDLTLVGIDDRAEEKNADIRKEG